MPANSVFNLVTATVGLVALVLRIRYHVASDSRTSSLVQAQEGEEKSTPAAATG
jgi:hypothetical protein